MSGIKIVKMTALDMHEILFDQPILAEHITEDQILALVSSKHSYTVVNAYGKVLGVGGIVEKWKGRAEAWAILDQNSREYFLCIHNAVKRFLNGFNVRRIEAEVDCNFEAGHRWMRLLGFKKEADRMRFFDPAGNDCSLYSLVKEDN